MHATAKWMVFECMAMMAVISLVSFFTGVVFSASKFSFDFLLSSNPGVMVSIGVGAISMALWLLSFFRKIAKMNDVR